MKKWIIREPSNIKKVISRLGKPEKRKYFELLKSFQESDDPTKFADEEQYEKGMKVYYARLNIKFRTKYTVYPNENIILIFAVGGHKEVGLKEY